MKNIPRKIRKSPSVIKFVKARVTPSVSIKSVRKKKKKKKRTFVDTRREVTFRATKDALRFTSSPLFIFPLFLFLSPSLSLSLSLISPVHSLIRMVLNTRAQALSLNFSPRANAFEFKTLESCSRKLPVDTTTAREWKSLSDNRFHRSVHLLPKRVTLQNFISQKKKKKKSVHVLKIRRSRIIF